MQETRTPKSTNDRDCSLVVFGHRHYQLPLRAEYPRSQPTTLFSHVKESEVKIKFWQKEKC